MFLRFVSMSFSFIVIILATIAVGRRDGSRLVGFLLIGTSCLAVFYGLYSFYLLHGNRDSRRCTGRPKPPDSYSKW